MRAKAEAGIPHKHIQFAQVIAGNNVWNVEKHIFQEYHHIPAYH